MRVSFNELYKELRSLSFDKMENVSYTDFDAIQASLSAIISTCFTSKSLSGEQINEYFRSSLCLSVGLNVENMNTEERDIYNMVRDERRMRKSLSYSKKDPVLTEVQQESFRSCVEELYPQIIEAAQAIKDRVEFLSEDVMGKENRENGATKRVTWADKYPSREVGRQAVTSAEIV